MPDDPRLALLVDALGGPDGLRFVRAPGRVNLIGDHTDYQDGLCLPMAIDLDVVAAFRPRDDARVSLRSLDLDDAVEVAADGRDDPLLVEPTWGRDVGGVVRVLAGIGRASTGADVAVASTVPIGAGLSSSAAFEVAVTLALAEVAGTTLAGTDLALAAQAAAHAAGVPCGVLDQMAAVHGRAGHALRLDCRDLSVVPIPLPGGVEVVVVHSGLPRILADSAYAARRAACEAAAAHLGLSTLRDATPEQVADDPRARHVVAENARVAAFAAALERGDVDALGPLMMASHRSLRDDFGVSTPELDVLVDLLVARGALGARLTGAGFGGCVVGLVPAGSATAVAAATTSRYRATTGLEPRAFTVRAVDGAGPLLAG